MHNNIFTSLDLELNKDPTTGPKIIQIGAVVGDLVSGNIIEKFSVYVNPHQQLTPEIISRSAKIKAIFFIFFCFN